jgi:hypothetical protein
VREIRIIELAILGEADGEAHYMSEEAAAREVEEFAFKGGPVVGMAARRPPPERASQMEGLARLLSLVGGGRLSEGDMLTSASARV